MIAARGFENRQVALFGLGVSGLAAARSLAAGGAEVQAWDDAPERRAQAEGHVIRLENLAEADWNVFSSLVLAPGVPLTHPKPHWTVERAHAANVEIIGDMEIFQRAINGAPTPARYVGITGTNGKSTTTALLGHVLKHAGMACEIGGNIGVPVLDLSPVGQDRIYIVELSSYQIDLAPGLAPTVAVLLNVSPDHIERHGDFENYAAVKTRIFDGQSEADTAVVGVDDETGRTVVSQFAGHAHCVPVSSSGRLEEGIFVDNGVLFEASGGAVREHGVLAGMTGLRGVHNWQNAAASFAAARALGAEADDIISGFATFRGLVHRMENVAQVGHVLVVNDSKATNADAAARALASFDNIYWIAGGLAKDGGIESLRRYFKRIKKAYLIGDAMEAFADVLANDVTAQKSATMENAVVQALNDATGQPGEAVVLFSPACASFDQFRNFEIRGDAFKSAVARYTERERER